MGDVVNLNKFRKKKMRNQSEKQAKEHRIQYGRTKQQKKIDRLAIVKNRTLINGKKLTKQHVMDESSNKKT